jgi:hypothetical protein
VGYNVVVCPGFIVLLTATLRCVVYFKVVYDIGFGFPHTVWESTLPLERQRHIGQKANFILLVAKPFPNVTLDCRSLMNFFIRSILKQFLTYQGLHFSCQAVCEIMIAQCWLLYSIFVFTYILKNTFFVWSCLS